MRKITKWQRNVDCLIIVLLGISIACVMVWAPSDVKTVKEYPMEATCDIYGADSVRVSPHGMLTNAYTKRENVCWGTITSYNPLGIAANALPGLVFAVGLPYFYFWRLRWNMR